MKNLFRLLSLCAALALLLPLPAPAGQEAAPLMLKVYLYDACGGCGAPGSGCRDCALVDDVYGRLWQTFKQEVLGGQYEIKVRNLIYDAVRKEHASYLKAFGKEDAPMNRMPHYVVGEPGWGELVIGEDLEKTLPEVMGMVRGRMPSDGAWRRTPKEGQAFIDPRSDALSDVRPEDSLILYLFKDYCPYCKELEPLFASLPDTVTLANGKVSRVRMVSLEKQIPAQMAVVQRYYDMLRVHPDRQYVPMVIVGDKALFLKEEIEPGLMPALLAGEGLRTDRTPLEALK